MGSGQDLFDDAAKRLSLRLPLANFVGAVLALSSGALTSAGIKGQFGAGWGDVVLLVIYLAIAGPVGFFLAGRTCLQSSQWLIADRTATRDEQRRVLLVPL